ncbi:MAG TPA: Uma2 family endonuclease [Blastocatellia bacterium]|nr:Uma2 family endonuclease [Blastocatellia bacterium]
MITETTEYLAVVERMPKDTVVLFHNATWNDYEELIAQVGEAAGLRISFNDGTLKVMTLSHKHEQLVRFIDGLVSTVRLRLSINILFFGSATRRTRKKKKGVEPDGSFYVQTASVIGNRIDLDMEVDPPPDVVVEVDINHDSRDNYPIYAAFGVPEIWRYDGEELTIYLLQETDYVRTETSLALPMLDCRVLTDYLRRMQKDGELDAILAFDEWLKSLPR